MEAVHDPRRAGAARGARPARSTRTPPRAASRPTSGYRHYVDELLDERQLPAPAAGGVELGDMRREVDEAMRATTEQLSQVTNLLAVVSAPPIETTTIRHVEVLLLQPQVAMVVVITSTGGVTKRVISYDEPVDPGLVDWAGSYLNEPLAGMELGAPDAARALTDPSLGAGERAFLATLAPAFTELEETAEDSLYFGRRRAAAAARSASRSCRRSTS